MLRQLIHFTAAVMVALAALLAVGSSGQQETAPDWPRVQLKKTPAPYTAPASGKEMYLAYCASCHGKDGKGHGPAAPALKSGPADLTRLAANNGGKFPENHVSQIIKGASDITSHGAKDMPVWGPVFRAMAAASDGTAQLRVRNLTNYIASLQQR